MSVWPLLGSWFVGVLGGWAGARFAGRTRPRPPNNMAREAAAMRKIARQEAEMAIDAARDLPGRWVELEAGAVRRG